MPLSPCQHCGNNFMQALLLTEGLRLCNNCNLKNENRTQREKNMEDSIVNILIKCPKEYQARIEEDCVARGIDFSKFFMNLYEDSQKKIHFSLLEEGMEDLEYPKSLDEKKENYSKKKR